MWATRPHLGSIFEKLLHRKTFYLPAARISQPIQHFALFLQKIRHSLAICWKLWYNKWETSQNNTPKRRHSMTHQETFIQIYQEHIHRRGADQLLAWLQSDASDFFTAPSSTRYHGSYEGGLVEHSLNVYHCLVDYLARPRTKELYGMDYSDETVALVALMHDICKVNFYVVDYRNAKNEQGVWEKVPYYTIRDEMPYGHGEKSVYMLSGFLRLSREEAFAIRYHMGFSGPEDRNQIGRALELFPLALALNVADMEASYFLEGTPDKSGSRR
jgi:hypothetical protein